MSRGREEEPSKLLTVCPYILGNELGERLAFGGMMTNFVNYLKKLGASSISAAAVMNVWAGFYFLFPLLGGWIADSMLGRFKTILIFSIVYLTGSVMLTASAAIPGIRVEDGDEANAAQWTLLALCLLLLALGAGGLKPNVSAFGADQFDDTKERDRKEKESFFSWFYMFINIGGLIAMTLIVYIQDQGMWDIGFGIPAVVLLVAVVLFFVGQSKYNILPPSEYPLCRFFKVIAAAWVNRKRAHRSLSTISDNDDVESANGVTRDAEELWLLHEQSEPHPRMETKHWLDWALVQGDFTEEQVNEVKMVYGVFPFLFVLILSSHNEAALVILQGNQMDRNVTLLGLDFEMPAASMMLFNTLTVITLIPIYELVMLPLLKRCFNYKPTILQRVGTGLFIGVIAYTSIYLIEWRRLQLFNSGHFHQADYENDEEVVEMSIWWQVIPYTLLGTAQVLAATGMMEFYYKEAPVSMRSTMGSIFMFSASLGGYLSSLVLIAVNAIGESTGDRWITDNLNEGHLDDYILVMTGIAVATFFLFLRVAMHYQYQDVSHSQIDDNLNESVTLRSSITHHNHQPNPSVTMPLIL